LLNKEPSTKSGQEAEKVIQLNGKDSSKVTDKDRINVSSMPN
jgi:hypothetical protein